MHNQCVKCIIRNEPKTYEISNVIDDVSWHFDVQLAMGIVQRLHIPALPIPKELLEHVIQVNDVEDQHIDHVDMSQPLIFGFLPSDPKPPCAIILGSDNGEPDQLIIPMDGSHRAARALRDGIQVSAYYLTERMTMSCLVAIEDRKNETFVIKQSAYIQSMMLAIGGKR